VAKLEKMELKANRMNNPEKRKGLDIIG